MICDLGALDLAHNERRVQLLDASIPNRVVLVKVHILELLELFGSYGFRIDEFASIELNEVVSFDRLRVGLVELVDKRATQYIQEVHVRLKLAIVDQLVWLILFNGGCFPNLLADNFR